MNSETTLAKRYATAYVNLFEDQIDLKVCGQLEDAYNFFGNNAVALLVLKLSTVTPQSKKACIESLITLFKLPDTLLRMIDLLLAQNRAHLFPLVLLYIARLYKERNNITHYKVTSSHELSDQAIEVVLAYLKQVTEKHILYTIKVDKRLIAGLRLLSDTTLWEYSVNKQLAQLQHNFNG